MTLWFFRPGLSHALFLDRRVLWMTDDKYSAFLLSRSLSESESYLAT